MEFDLTVSIVLYNANVQLLEMAIKSVYKTQLNVKLYLVDNSPSDVLRTQFPGGRYEYIFSGKNLGFGKAHNTILSKSLEKAKYHLVLNPDVHFDGNVLDELFEYMEKNQEVGLITPKILYPDGNTQYLCKLLPTPADLFGRRFLGNTKWMQRRNEVYEMRPSGYNTVMNVPYLSGCFMFLRTSVLKELGLFDERIFMYIEDADLTRRIHKKYKTLFYPYVHIFHHYAKGSYKNTKLMLYNIHGASVYFSKWGWFFDKERRRINQHVINQYLSK